MLLVLRQTIDQTNRIHGQSIFIKGTKKDNSLGKGQSFQQIVLGQVSVCPHTQRLTLSHITPHTKTNSDHRPKGNI